MKGLKEKIQEGKAALGTWSILPSVHLMDVIGCSGLDFIIFDREHGPFSYETITSMVPVCEKWGMSPLVRVPEVSQSEIQRALDSGVHGLHVPGIVEVEQVEALISYAKYPPLGQRGLSPYTAGNQYSSSDIDQKIPRANATTLLAIHLEGPHAIDHIETFFSYEEIDIFFIGLYDLSNALGLNGNVHHPEVWKVLKHVLSLADQKNRCIGTIASSLEDLERLRELDVKYITYAGDCYVIHEAYRHIVHRFKKQKEYQWN